MFMPNYICQKVQYLNQVTLYFMTYEQACKCNRTSINMWLWHFLSKLLFSQFKHHRVPNHVAYLRVL